MNFYVTAEELNTVAAFNDIARAYAFRRQLLKLGYTAEVYQL